MRRKVKVRSSSIINEATTVWFQHLINRIIVEQLELPNPLKAKLLHEAALLKKRGE